MIQLFKLAFRDLARNRRRSFLSALALGIGLGLLLLMAAVIKGEMNQSLDTAIRLQSGHIQIRAASYNEDKMSLVWGDLIENPDAIAAQVAALPVVKVATPRLYIGGIITAGEFSTGVNVVGIEPSSTANAPYRDGLIGGEFLAADDRQGVLIGKTLAEKADLKTGDSVQLLVNTSDGTVDEQPFTVRGIYTTHTPGYDENVVLMPLAKAQTITQTEVRASSIFILLKDQAQTAAATAALKAPQYQVKTWEQMNALLVETEKFSGAYMVLLYLIVLAITATVIVNTLIMTVFERTREIGILAAIGMKSTSIMAMFFAESSLLAVGGIIIGLVLGGIMVAYATFIGFTIGNMGATGILLGETIYAHLTVSDTLTLTFLTLIVSLLAALYPALLAARMEPVDALHGGK